MRLRVVKCEQDRNRGLWKIQKYSLLWSWEDFASSTTKFESYDEAYQYALELKLIGG